MTDHLENMKKDLIKSVRELVRLHGFRSQGASSFYRDEQFGKSAFLIGFVEHEDSFDVTADVGLRVEDVENLINAHDHRLTEKEKSRTMTAGADLGNIAEGSQLRFTVARPEDVPTVAKSLCEALEEIGLPYIARFKDLEGLFDALSSNDYSASLHSPINYKRCERVVALALVLKKDEEELERTIRNCERYLSESDDPGLSLYRDFITRVRQN